MPELAQRPPSTIPPWKLQHSTNSDCVRAEPLPHPRGVAVTIAIVAVADADECKTEGDSKYKGIVYYGDVAEGWYCLSDADLESFKTWALASFAKPKLVSKATNIRTCPPPPLHQL